MRLKELLYILKRAAPGIDYTSGTVTLGGTNYSRITNLISLRYSLNLLHNVGVMEEEILRVKDSDIFSVADDLVNLQMDKAKQVKADLTTIKVTIANIIAILDPFLGSEESTSIYIKLPKVNDLADMAKSISHFHKIFSQTILDPEIGGKVTVRSVDNGSIWIEILVETAKAVMLIGSITASAVLIFKERQKALLIAEQARSRKLSNDRIEKLQTAQLLLIEEMLEYEAEQIKAVHFVNDIPAKVKLLKESINWLSNEMQNGAEVRPALDAPKEVDNLFGDVKKYLAYFPTMKGISESSDTEEKKES